MRPYGVKLTENPDKQEILEQGRSTKFMKQNSGRKRRTRRYWKKRIRRDLKV